MRAFIAIPIGKKLSDEILKLSFSYEQACGAKYLRLTPVKNYHITLCFLGGINHLQQMHLSDELKLFDYCFDAFELEFDVVSPFPVGYPKVIAIMIKPNDYLIDLQKKVIKMLKSAKIQYKQTKFIPHLTIARVKNLKEIQQQPIYPFVNFNKKMMLDQICLYESQLKNTGAIYIKKVTSQLKV